MRAILLLGGLGTRLRPFTLAKPKPLLPILDRPMIAWQVERLRRFGVREVVLALGYGAAHFRRSLGTGRAWGVRFIYSLESEPLGTGGAIRLASKHVQGPTLVLNGDILSDLDLAAFAAFHRRQKADATLSLVAVPDPSAFGVVETAADGRVKSFLEKPAPGTTKADTINAGCYLFEPSIFSEIPEGRPVSVEREVFPALVRGGRRLFGLRHGGYWLDVGTLETYLGSHADLLKGNSMRSRPGARRLRKGLWAAPGARVHPSAVVKGHVYLGPKCRVEEGAVLEGFVCAGAGTVIGEKASVSDSVLHARVRVGAGAKVAGSLVGEGASLGANCQVQGMAVAPGSAWGDYSRSFSCLDKPSRNG